MPLMDSLTLADSGESEKSAQKVRPAVGGGGQTHSDRAWTLRDPRVQGGCGALDGRLCSGRVRAAEVDPGDPGQRAQRTLAGPAVPGLR